MRCKIARSQEGDRLPGGLLTVAASAQATATTETVIGKVQDGLEGTADNLTQASMTISMAH